MSTFVNDQTGVQVSVDDSKDARFGEGWTPVGDKPAEKKSTSKKSDS
jgi:hypothetical protein